MIEFWIFYAIVTVTALFGEVRRCRRRPEGPSPWIAAILSGVILAALWPIELGTMIGGNVKR